jgi:hypothetical protein
VIGMAGERYTFDPAAGNHGIQRWYCAAETQDQQQLIDC